MNAKLGLLAAVLLTSCSSRTADDDIRRAIAPECRPVAKTGSYYIYRCDTDDAVCFVYERGGIVCSAGSAQ